MMMNEASVVEKHENRAKYINDLSKVIEDATSLVDGFLFGLGWTRDKILDVRNSLFYYFHTPISSSSRSGNYYFGEQKYCTSH